MPRLQNLVIEKVVKAISKHGRVKKPWLDYVYSETVEGSVPRKLFGKIGMTLSSAYLEKAARWFPAGYLVDVVKELLQRSNYEFNGMEFSQLLVSEDT